MARIQPNGRTAKGDKGTSNLISGWTIRKSHQLCNLQNEIEFLRNDFSSYLFNYGQALAAEDIELFNYYKLNLNNLSALVYFKFNNIEFASQSSHVDALEERLQAIADQIAPAKDFVIPETNRSLALDYVRVRSRKVEHLLWVVIDKLYGECVDEYNDSIKITAREFNALSDYLYSLNRYEGLKENTTELHWVAPTA